MAISNYCVTCGDFSDDYLQTVDITGVSKKRFRKLPKQLIFSQTILNVSSNLLKPVSLKFESKLSTNIDSDVISRISYNDVIPLSSKILCEIHQPIKSIVSRDYSVPIKGRLNSMEINMNKFVKYNKIQNILSLID